MTCELQSSSFPLHAHARARPLREDAGLRCRCLAVTSSESISGKMAPIKQPWSDTASAKAQAMRHTELHALHHGKTLLASHKPWCATSPSNKWFCLQARRTLGYWSAFVFLSPFSQVIQVRGCVSAAQNSPKNDKGHVQTPGKIISVTQLDYSLQKESLK